VYIGALVAVAFGASAGVMAAILHNRAESTATSAPVSAPPAPPTAAASVGPGFPLLSDEHVLEEDGLILKAGFEHAPSAGQLATIQVGLAGGQGPIIGADVQLFMTGRNGTEESILCTPSGTAGQYRAYFNWPAAGKQKLKVVADRIFGRSAPLVLGFDVDARPGLGPPSRAGRGEPRRSRKNDDDDVSDDNLPMTRVPPDPEPAPRLLAKPPAPPRDVTAQPAPAPPAPAPLPPPQPATVSAPPQPTSVIEHPKPIAPPHRDPPRRPPPSEPPDEPPPSASDPTTLPAPSPDDPTR
jgi:hypothetical protein